MATIDTPRTKMPYPTKDTTDWYDELKSFFLSADSHIYAHREDRNLVMYSSALWTWDAGTGQLVWDAAFYFTGAQTGGRWKIDAGNLSIDDGYMMVVKIPRYPQGTIIISTVEARQACEVDDEGVVVCVRVGSVLYFRNGISVSSGSSINIFAPGGVSPGGSVEAHQEDMHSNGITRSLTSGTALDLSVTDNGGAVDDDLVVGAVPAGDKYYVEGKQRTEPSAAFTFTNPAIAAGVVRLYRAILPSSGDPLLQERIEFSLPAGLDHFSVVDCSRDASFVGVKNLVFTTVVAGNFWKLVFDGGPALLVPSGQEPKHPVRVYSNDGVNWVDVFFGSAWDWTKVDIGGPHTAALAFSAEVDEKASMISGSVAEWNNGAAIQWGYDTTKEAVDQRYFGNLSEDEIRDDLLKSISERAWINGLNGVIFDRKAYWTALVGGTPLPMMQWPEYNFSLEYNGGAGTITIHGGKLFVDGEVVEVPSATLNLNLTSAGTDYYIWWDKSDGTIKATESVAFPLVGPSPLAYILGGSIGLPDYIDSYVQIDKPSRGVPLYVVQRGGSDTTIDEGSLCDLRRNVTKAALKNHVSVGFRPDWPTANFPVVGNAPDITQSEGEFGCLDAAFRYMNAVPYERGGGEWGSGSVKVTGRVVEVVGYTEERRFLTVPIDTELRGSGFAQVAFHPNATPDTGTWALYPFGVMLNVPDSVVLKDLVVFAHGDNGVRATVGLIGDQTPSPTGVYMRHGVFDNCTVFSTGQCALQGQFPRSIPGGQGLEYTFYKSSFVSVNQFSHVTPGYGVYFGDNMQNLSWEDCLLIGEDYGIYKQGGGFAQNARIVGFSRCAIAASSLGGPPSALWPNGNAISIPGVQGLFFKRCWINTDHAYAINAGGGGKSETSVEVSECVVQSLADLSGSGANKTSFVQLGAGPIAFRDNFVFGPQTAATESQMELVTLAPSQTSLDVSRNYLSLYGFSDAVAWNYVVNINALGSVPVSVAENRVVGCTPITGGLTVGIYFSARDVKIEENAIDLCAGVGIDWAGGYAYDQRSIIISNNIVNGESYGNGIRGAGLIEGNIVKRCLSWGISAFPHSKVLNNDVLDIDHLASRPEGDAPLGEYSAWGIRYGHDPLIVTTGNLDNFIIKNNTVRSIIAKTESGIGNNDLCCGIGPEKEFAGRQNHLQHSDISNNTVQEVASSGLVATDNYGIALAHPRLHVRCDQNDVSEVGLVDTMIISVGVGVISGSSVPDAEITDVSICGNFVEQVLATVYSVGIYAGSGTRISVNDNKVSSVFVAQATALIHAHIAYQDQAGLGGREQQIHVCRNEMGQGQFAAPPGYVSIQGIVIGQGNPATPVSQIECNENQMDGILTSLSSFIYVQTNGSQVTVKKNQHKFELELVTIPSYGIRVVPFSTTIKDVDVSQNMAYGEYTTAFIGVQAADGLIVSDNIQKGQDAEVQYGDGIQVEECVRINVHDNEILLITPNTGNALIRVIDSIFGAVHSNVLKASTNIPGPVDSLRFEDSTAGAAALCDDLHIHDNKIEPNGLGGPIGPYDIGFYPTAGVPGPTPFGINMTIWNNVFGNPGVGGTENFATAPPAAFYVPAPAPNNWNGGVFV